MRKKTHSCGQAKVTGFSPPQKAPEVNAMFEIPEALRLIVALNEAIRRANLIDQRSAEPLICVRISNSRFIVKTNPTLDPNGDLPSAPEIGGPIDP